MMQTAEPLDAVDADLNAERVDGRPPGIDPPGNRPKGSKRLARLLVGCLATEAVIGVIALAGLAGLGGLGGLIGTTSIGVPPADIAPGGDHHDPNVGTTAPVDGSETLVRAWERSLETDHEAVGTVTRTALGGDALYSSSWPDPQEGASSLPSTEWPYRYRHHDGRSLTRIGDAATIVDPDRGRQSCLARDQGLVCSPDPVDETDAGSAIELLTGVEQAVRGASAPYLVTPIEANDIAVAFPRLPVDIDCWEARARRDGVGQRWGRRAQFCFHRPTGAAVFRRILATTRVEVLVVHAVEELTDFGP